MEGEQRVGARLERIEALRRGRTSGRVLLAELRALLADAEAVFAAEAAGVPGGASVSGLLHHGGGREEVGRGRDLAPL